MPGDLAPQKRHACPHLRTLRSVPRRPTVFAGPDVQVENDVDAALARLFHNPVHPREVDFSAAVANPISLGILKRSKAKRHADHIEAESLDGGDVPRGEPIVLPDPHQRGGLFRPEAGFQLFQGLAIVLVLLPAHPALRNEPAADVDTAQHHHVAFGVDDVVSLRVKRRQLLDARLVRGRSVGVNQHADCQEGEAAELHQIN